jgi:hypothetical protein
MFLDVMLNYEIKIKATKQTNKKLEKAILHKSTQN